MNIFVYGRIVVRGVERGPEAIIVMYRVSRVFEAIMIHMLCESVLRSMKSTVILHCITEAAAKAG